MTAPSALPRDQMEAFWMPFTANRQFKANPRMLAKAKGMHYWTPDGRQILDAVAGLWCVNAGHGRAEISDAVATQIATMEYAPPFQMGHPAAFQLANDVASWLPKDMGHVFFTNSGSESVDTALKIALAYHRARGEASRTRFIGRERGYHGVGFGGISVGGMVNNRKWFGSMLPGVDHLPHTHDLAKNAYTRGVPEHGANLADELERIVALHDASNIAAVIVEPVAGSTGVLIPPKGYLERLRSICTRHGILLIFDEVITGFGRLGSPFGTSFFGVQPDMITMAKGLTNGAVPMGAVAASDQIYDAFMQGPEGAIELFHGYTYSAHPVACAAGIATQEIYRKEGLLTRANDMAGYWADGVHSLRGLPQVIDLRNLGLIGAVELDPIPGKPGLRGYNTFVRAFEQGLLLRVTGDIIAMSPPLIIEKQHIDQVFGILGGVLKELG
jgi:beta-alanine--pyruvate transaminase